MSIIAEKVTRKYGSQKALDEVSFSIGSGEIAGFIGPNGAGKTTLMKIIMGIIPAGEGRVQVNGLDVTRDSLKVRQQVGYLPETNPLYPEMYVREYLRHVAGLYRMGKNGRRRTDEMILLTGLEKEQHKKIGALSKGYRQRVGLAQALIHDPAVLILDEPTSGLDPNQIVEIRNLISQSARSKTVLLSTHIMQEVEAICDRIIIIHQGKIVADRKAAEIGNTGDDNTQTILLGLGGEVTPGLLEAIPGIMKVLPVGDKQWLLQGPAGEDFRKIIFRFAADRDLPLLSLQKQEQSLEQVFRKLTRQE